MLSLKIYVGGLGEGETAADWMISLTDIHFLSMAFIMWILCLLVHVLVSLSSPPPSEEQVKELTWNRGIFREETEEMRGLPWYQNYRILAIILLLITAVVVGYFW
jgi:SSS family solute:Na+ symporter